MNKTQLLSDTENLCIARKVTQIISEQKWVTWYSNDGTLVCGRGCQDHIFLHTKQENPACFIFVDSFPTNTLQIHKCIKDIQI